MTESSEEIPATPEEFEFVLGRRQMASLAFVLLIVLVVCVSIAYLVGKSTSIKAAAAAGLAQTAAAPAPEPPPIILHSDPAPTLDQPDRPLFADPKIGAVYIQMGAVEKGVAAIFAEGLRRKGLPGFVAPGPSEKIFRVLIGPLPTPASYIEAKDAVDRLGLTTFARRFPD
ncbi:MAG TPA: hypothetical protein VMT15_13365 [Bryobacteraceae bacterium]|nr:hypothetical protein [Bryobacteraceae bacterium]